jgi:hypothetical protein
VMDVTFVLASHGLPTLGGLMGTHRFDELTRAAAGEVPRRRLLALLATAAGGALVTGIVSGFGSRAGTAHAGTAQRAGTGQRAALAAVTCTGTNHVDGSLTCGQFKNQYVPQCGVICPNGQPRPGWAGCTSWQYESSPATGPIRGPITYSEDPFLGGVCASRTTNWSFTILDNSSDILHYRPTYPLADPATCHAEIDRFTNELLAHEEGHRINFANAVAEAGSLWTDRRFRSCAETQWQAAKSLNSNITAAANRTLETIRLAAEHEPPQAQLDCGRCIPPCPSWAPIQCSPGSCCAAGSYCCPQGCCWGSGAEAGQRVGAGV